VVYICVRVYRRFYRPTGTDVREFAAPDFFAKEALAAGWRKIFPWGRGLSKARRQFIKAIRRHRSALPLAPSDTPFQLRAKILPREEILKIVEAYEQDRYKE
jgi:hypothetical protein